MDIVKINNQQKPIMKYLSLFSGIGGFELGIQQAYENNNRLDLQKQTTEGIQKGKSNTKSIPRWRPTCIGFSEIDKYATQIYKKHFNHKEYGDITKINEKELPDFDLLVGGFPCQSFSIAGKRGGFMDTRGTMFFEIARIVKEKQPRLLLLENVKGILSHDKGNTFATIISTLDELGYDVQWQVLNSKNFGVPQNRERVFIIGHLRGSSRPQVFPIGGAEQETAEPSGISEDANQEISRTLLARDYKDPKLVQVNQPKHSNDRVYSEEGLSPTLNTMQGGNRQPFICKPVITPDRLNKRQNGRRMKENGEPAFTCTAQDRHGVMLADILERKEDSIGRNMPLHRAKQIIGNMKIRRLTPTECMRLQGFPDDWCDVGADGKEISDSQKYKMAGNAVTVNVIEEIIKRLI